MTSQINPNNINGAYPVAGQDNNSQGFRDNFTNTKNNFQYASDEITALQNNTILKGNISGVTLNNNMGYNVLANAQIKGFSQTVASSGTQSTLAVSYSAGHYQTVTTGASLGVSFSGWPAAGQYGWVTLAINVTSIAYTVSLPAAVSINTTGIKGLNPSTNVITFSAPGLYTFTFSTIDNGTTIAINQTTSSLQPLNNSYESLATTGAANLALTTSYFTTAGTATLAAGVSGQIKVLTQTTAASMVVTVTNPGWTGAGTITMAAQGSSCTLQYTNSKWYCIGNNGATFA